MGDNQVQAEQAIPPYVSYATFRNTIRQFGEDNHIPDQIDTSCFPSMAGGTQSQFMVALRSLRLIDDDGKPFEVFTRLAKATDEAWGHLIKDLLSKCFPAQVSVLGSGSMKQLRDAYPENVSSSVAEKSIRFLLSAAKDAKIGISPAILKAKISTGRPSRSGRPKQDGHEPEGDDISDNGGTDTSETVSFPIHIPGKAGGKIVVPKGLSESDLPMVEAMMAVLRVYAKGNNA